ncbi:MAG TPA: helix-turn-helix domain-containing protein, partial [Cyclobacteriaceae bacterium]|nr:helix-turn-helix domain-containing protein [Cyclobacteriaceae bacterium]
KKMLATLVKEGRIAKGFTQKELSELTNISTRSIQRIENGELTPRLYTIKTLSATLGFGLDDIESELTQQRPSNLNTAQKIILSVGVSLFIGFLAWAFTAQSNRFPETHFETLLFLAGVMLIITLVVFLIWRRS